MTRVRALASAMAVGAVFIVASLPDAAAALSLRPGWRWLGGAADASAALKAALPPVADLLVWVAFALVGYGTALALLALRHGRLGLLGWGAGTAVVSAFVLHLLAWVGVIGFVVGGFAVRVVGAVLGWVFGVIGWFVALVRGVALAVVGLFRPFLGALAWVGAVLVLAVVLGLAFRLGGELLRIAVLVAVAVAVGFAALAGIGALLGLVPGAFWASVRAVAGAVVAVVLGAFVLATVGRLFLDQLRSGAHAGSGRTGVVMGLCGIGVLRNLSRMRPEPDPLTFRRSLVYTVMGMITAGAIAALDKATSDG